MSDGTATSHGSHSADAGDGTTCTLSCIWGMALWNVEDMQK